MIDHLVINCADYTTSQRFYDRVVRVLGFSRLRDFGEAIGYGRDGKADFWIAEGAAMGPNREAHFAFAAADHDSVRAFHDAAVELGAESRLWPEYGEGYFAAFVHDPDGNNVEAVCHA